MSAGKTSRGRPLSRPISAVLTIGREEAERAGHGYIGVEHLPLVLAHPTAPATRRLLADHGISLDRARGACPVPRLAVRRRGQRADFGVDLGRGVTAAAALVARNRPMR